jgi:hypothetical protein
MWHVVGFILSLLISANVFAQTIQLKGDFFIRSSKDFLATDNKVGVLHSGSTFRIINSTPLRNSAEALEIEPISLTGKSNVNPSPTGRYFIYKKNSSLFMNRSEAEGKSVATGSSDCPECRAKAQQEKVASDNIDSLSEVVSGLVEQANKAPKEEKDPPKPEPLHMPVLRAGSLDDKIKNYSNSSEVENMISWAMKNKSPRSKGLCYRKVKEALATQCGPAKPNYVCRNAFAPKGGKLGPGNNLIPSVSTEMADQAALSAKTRLKNYGFVNLLEIEPYKSQMKSPSQAPKGAVLVYSSGIPCAKNPDCGHIEIKTDIEGRPGYVSDYYFPNPINETARTRKVGSKYKLVGVMIKPKD